MEHFAPATITGTHSRHNIDEDREQKKEDKEALDHCSPVSSSTTRSDSHARNEIEDDEDKTAEYLSTPLTPHTPVQSLVSRDSAPAAQSPLYSHSVEPLTPSHASDCNKGYNDNITNIIAEANRRATTQKVTRTYARWPARCLQCRLLGLPCDQARPQCGRCARRLRRIENPPILPPSQGPRNTIDFASWAVLGTTHHEEPRASESYNTYLTGPATAGSFASSATEKEVMQSSCVALRVRDFVKDFDYNKDQNRIYALLPPRNRLQYFYDDRYIATQLTRMRIEKAAEKKWGCRLDSVALWDTLNASKAQQDSIAPHKEEDGGGVVPDTVALSGVRILEGDTLVRPPERGGITEERLDTDKAASDERMLNARGYELWEMALELEQKKNDRQNWVAPCRYKTDKGWLGLPSRLKESERGLVR